MSTGDPTSTPGASYYQPHEHAARRFAQIQDLQRLIELKEQEVRDSKARTRELQDEADGLAMELRAAARDEGELPLLDMMEAPPSTRSN